MGEFLFIALLIGEKGSATLERVGKLALLIGGPFSLITKINCKILSHLAGVSYSFVDLLALTNSIMTL